MFNGFRWLVVVIGVGVPIAWLTVPGLLHRAGPDSRVESAAASRNGPETAGKMKSPESPREEPDGNEIRESKRHAEGDVEKNRLPALEKAVAAQELVLKEKREVLSNIIRTKGIVYKGPDSPPPTPTPEHVEVRKMDAGDYVNAKNEVEKEQKLLESMKLKLTEEKAAAEAGDK